MIRELFPRTHDRYLSLPLLGSLAADLAQWLLDEGYQRRTRRQLLRAVVPIDRALRRRRLDRVSVLTRRDLIACWTWYRRRNVRVAGTVQVLQRFLTHRGLLAPPQSGPPTRTGVRLAAYATYLRDVRGLDPATIHQHVVTAEEFLRHVKYETHPTRLAALSARDLEAFIHRAGARLRRGTLQHVVARVRGLLRFLASAGVVRAGLDTQIDTPRVYRLERLPRTLPWDTVHAFLRSIDRTTPIGLRDYTMFFLVATYGLRACEIAALTLDDLDWRAGILRVPPRKHGTPLLLPLTDAAGTVLLHYLRRGRPPSSHRELFLRARAPAGVLQRTAVTDAFQAWSRRSGLGIPFQGPHCLRHSYAVHLLRRGIPLRTLGALLGHRSADSTCVYLRLALEDLRGVALSLPRAGSASRQEGRR